MQHHFLLQCFTMALVSALCVCAEILYLEETPMPGGQVCDVCSEPGPMDISFTCENAHWSQTCGTSCSVEQVKNGESACCYLQYECWDAELSAAA